MPFPTELWQNPWVRGLVYLLLMSVGIYALYLTRGALYPFLISFILAYMLNPLIDSMERVGRNRVYAVVAFFFLLVLASILTALLVIPMLIGQFVEMFSNLPTYISTLVTQALPWFEETLNVRIPQSTEEFLTELKSNPALQNVVPEDFSPVLNGFTWATSSAMNFMTVLLNAVLIPIFVFYFLLEYQAIISYVDDAIPKPLQKRVRFFASEIDEALGSFIRGQLTVALFMAVMYSAGLYFSGVPMWLLIGVFSGAISFIPYLGLVMGIMPALLLALAEHGDIWHPLYVVITFSVVQFLEGNIVTPKVMGDSIGLHPLAVMLALLVAGNLLGLFGMIIAVPLAAVLKVFIREGMKAYKASEFYTGPKRKRPQSKTKRS